MNSLMNQFKEDDYAYYMEPGRSDDKPRVVVKVIKLTSSYEDLNGVLGIRFNRDQFIEDYSHGCTIRSDWHLLSMCKPMSAVEQLAVTSCPNFKDSYEYFDYGDKTHGPPDSES